MMMMTSGLRSSLAPLSIPSPPFLVRRLARDLSKAPPIRTPHYRDYQQLHMNIVGVRGRAKAASASPHAHACILCALSRMNRSEQAEPPVVLYFPSPAATEQLHAFHPLCCGQPSLAIIVPFSRAKGNIAPHRDRFAPMYAKLIQPIREY
ncbi:hypothetical protein CC80DRAFT_128236 [Byssothecium circinans]|uniref:Uncharacterized protein n=1 Tax=Byssothecium circinans TaxID=147558 RepID=A0A6A5TN70_9PLEO|nr:hypothetical protein CC80DRAFT_128236 [Byssothecium circinans]